MIVLDTHVLAWADFEERKLGRKARASARCRSGKWRGQLLAAGLLELPVDGNVALRAVGLGGLPSDPLDRLIVGTALHHDAELVRGDERLLGWDHPMIRHDARQ